MTRVLFNVSVTDDNILEKNVNFRVAIDPSSLSDNVTVSVPNRAKVKIVDDDGKYRDKINIQIYLHGASYSCALMHRYYLGYFLLHINLIIYIEVAKSLWAKHLQVLQFET